MLTRPSVVLAATIILLAGASCGGSDPLSKDEYEARMRPVVHALGPQLERMHATLGDPGRIAAIEREVALGRRSLQDAARRLEALAPPDEVERVHEGMAGASRQYARELEPIETAARCLDEDALELARARRSTAAVSAIHDAILAMRSRGYRIPKLSDRRAAEAVQAAPRHVRPADCAART